MDVLKTREKILAYLASKIKKFSITRTGKDKSIVMFSCPECISVETLPTATFMAGSVKISCTRCGCEGHISDLVQVLEHDKANLSVIEIEKYLFEKHGIKLETSVEYLLDFYERSHFDLVPIVHDSKVPFEKDWVNKTHTDKDEWKNWIKERYNFGVKTGSRSNVTVVDLDTTEIPDILKDIKTIRQVTPRGMHYFFQYEPELASSRIEELKIDLLCDGKQCVLYPSTVSGAERSFQFDGLTEIPKMPENLKAFFLSRNTGIKQKTQNEIISDDIKSDNIKDLNFLEEGQRNNSLIKLGGILRKKLNITDTTYVLELLNRGFVRPPLPYREFNVIVNSLDKYIYNDESELCQKIMDYLKYAEEGTSKDIEQAIGEKKTRIDKALSFLIKEKLILKRGRMFFLIKKLTWREDFPNLGNNVPFKMPFFHDIAHFCWGDMLLLGSKAKMGKTTIAMNIVKALVDQGIKPDYICLETGSRFIKTACTLGMKEGDFNWTIQTDPTKIELNKGSVTILDWLLISDKAQTDTVMQYFVEQLVRTNGFLIIFMQCKKDDSWFAPNMVEQFPSLSARYLYESENDGSKGYWEVDSIREPKKYIRGSKLPCVYLWDKKKIVRVDELEPEKKADKATDKNDEVLAI